jgi:hypothetical protein
MTESERAIVSTLSAIEARLARIEARLAATDRLMHDVPSFLGAATDAFDTAARTMEDQGKRPDESVRALHELAEVLARPKTLFALKSLAELAGEAPRMLAAAVDSLDEHASELSDRGVDLDARRKALFAAVERLSNPTMVTALTRLLDSGLLDAGALEVVGALGRSLQEAAHGPSSELGPFGLLGAIRDRDVKHALGFAVTLARKFGAATRKMKAIPALPGKEGDER